MDIYQPGSFRIICNIYNINFVPINAIKEDRIIITTWISGPDDKVGYHLTLCYKHMANQEQYEYRQQPENKTKQKQMIL